MRHIATDVWRGRSICLSVGIFNKTMRRFIEFLRSLVRFLAFSLCATMMPLVRSSQPARLMSLSHDVRRTDVRQTGDSGLSTIRDVVWSCFVQSPVVGF